MAPPSDDPASRPERLNRTSFQELYVRHWSAVVNYLRFRIGPLEAEDAASEIFSRLWSRRASYDPRRAPADHWLWASVRHAAIDALRRNNPEPEPVHPAVGDSLEDRTARQIDLLSTLHRLNATDHEILALRFGAGLPHQHIATVLGMRPGTVAVRMHRALLRLRMMETTSGDSA
jgi:RNA polymerase sigma-70 factor (ECF subfamily)